MENLTNAELWSRIVHYGQEARTWRQKFLGLLPEVNRRELWKVHGFESVFVFAFKVGGVSEEQVRRVLNIEKTFADMPLLHGLLVDGTISSNKLARIASVATIDNQAMLANQVQLLSQTAVETLVRDIKAEKSALESVAGKAVDVRTHTPIPLMSNLTMEFDLSPTLVARLNELKSKGIDVNSLLMGLLDQREEEISQAKQSMAAEMQMRSQDTTAANRSQRKPTRAIPARIKTLLKQEYGTRCAITTCHKPSKTIHHTARYGLQQRVSPYDTHNPLFLAPLCKEHHQIAHAIDVKVQEKKMESRRT